PRRRRDRLAAQLRALAGRGRLGVAGRARRRARRDRARARPRPRGGDRDRRLVHPEPRDLRARGRARRAHRRPRARSVGVAGAADARWPRAARVRRPAQGRAHHPPAPAMKVFLETTGINHTRRIGGLSALERRVRELAKRGATEVVVAAAPLEFPRPLPIPVAFVAPGSPAPAGAQVERGDVIAGIELVDDAARRRAEWAVIRRMNKSFEGPVDALINWRFSMRITRVLARRSLALTPNHVTIVAIAVGLLAA